MKEITYICNRCKLPIKGDVYRLYAGIVDQETDELSDETFYLEQTGEVELCGICLAQIDAGIKRMLSRNADTKVPAEKKKPFDITLAVALRDKGLSLEDIAKELGCCPQTVANKLKKVGYTKRVEDERTER